MSEVVHNTPQEFWRPPAPAHAEEMVVLETSPSMAEACRRCGTEFLLGSRFCHSCGGKRHLAISSEARDDAAAIAGLWEQSVSRMHSVVTRSASTAGTVWSRIRVPKWLHYLQFHEIKNRVGLSTASLIAFFLGVGCVAGALLVGLITAKTFVDWQAIQFYRAEWLLAATAAFVAGILLKKAPGRDDE